MTTTELPGPFAAMVERVQPRHDRPLRRERPRYEDRGTPMEGYLVAPDGMVGRRKAVLIFHAWMGVGENVEMRAEMLARLGYTAFCGDVYGAGVRPTTLAAMRAESERHYADLALMRARARAAADVLVDRGFVPEDIVVIGYCFGGTVALELARDGDPFAGVVAFHPRLLRHEPADAGSTAAPLLIVSGAEDDIVPDDDLTGFMDELRTSPSLDWRVSVHSGAPHAFTVPGTDRYRPLADARSWREFVDFLDELAPI